jgi:hypothetical protein
MALSKEAMLARTLKREDVEVEGGTVTVRAITRGEYQDAAGVGAEGGTDPKRFEKLVISAGLVEPDLGEHEVGQWIGVAAAGEVGSVLDAIMRLSGFRQGADKSGV